MTTRGRKKFYEIKAFTPLSTRKCGSKVCVCKF